MDKRNWIACFSLLLFIVILRGDSYGQYIPYTTRQTCTTCPVKAEEPKKEAENASQNEGAPSVLSQPEEKGEEDSLAGSGADDNSNKETITLIYPSDAQSEDHYLAFATRKAREPVEEGNIPLDTETPIGSIRNIGERLNELRNSIEEQRKAIDGLLKITREINSAKTTISETVEKKENSMHNLAIKVACYAVGGMTFLIVWTILVVKFMNFISDVFRRLVEKGLEKTTETLRGSVSKTENNSEDIRI